MKNKKKNSTTDRSSGKNDLRNFGFYSSTDPATNCGPNGMSKYKPEYIIPEPYRAACHMCKRVKLFMTIDELEKHSREVHYLKG